MPRVYLSETDKLKKRFQEFVFGRIKGLGLSQSKVANQMYMKQQTFSYKLRNLTFDIGELMDLLNILQVTPEELPQLMLRKDKK